MGGGVITLTLVAVRAFQFLDLERYGEAMSDPSFNLLIGLVAGVGVAAAFGWRRSLALENDWQRGVIAVLAAVGALLVAFLLAVPLYHFFGVLGLGGLTLASFGLGAAGSRWAVKGAGSGTGEAGSV
ncbi:MAG: hypothetical protein ACREL9_09075 [Gemmatimonadales bacterium]